jgi:hypothetical protein
MKQYIWIAVIMAVTGANAAENPFDLTSNLKKIDQSEKMLLNDLAKIAETQVGKKESGEKHAEAEPKYPAKEVKTPEQSSQPVEGKEKREAHPVTQSVTIETAEEKTARLREAEAEQARLESERAAKKAAEEKAERERKAAQKAAEEAAELARIKKAQAEKQMRLEAEKMEKEKKLVDSGKSEAATPSKKIEEINISREAAMASKAAEERLEEAIKEVDQE